MAKTRVETDTFGPVEVASDRYWGAQTQRSLENFRIANSPADRNYRGKHLQIILTVEDRGAFTMPWSATMTYGLGSTAWPETVCAENVFGFGEKNGVVEVPIAVSPDF